MQQPPSPLQLKHCELSITLHSKFTKSVQKILSFVLMANVSYEWSKTLAGRRAASGTYYYYYYYDYYGYYYYYYYYCVGRYSDLLWMDGPEIESQWGEFVRTRPDLPWGPPSLLHNGYLVFPGGKAGRGVALTTHLHLAPRLKKALPLLHLLAFVPCCRVNCYCTFTFTYCYYCNWVSTRWQ
jgi:hypothetical protein